MITSEEDLQSLGRDILEFPEYEVRSVMHSKKYALAARDILELWRKDQPTPEDAYNNLTAALSSAGWSQLAEDLSKWEPTGEFFFIFFQYFRKMSRTPLPKSANKAARSDFETQRRRHQKSKTGYQWPHNWNVSNKIFFF